MESVRCFSANLNHTVSILSCCSWSHEGDRSGWAVCDCLRVGTWWVSSTDCNCVDSGSSAGICNGDCELNLITWVSWGEGCCSSRPVACQWNCVLDTNCIRIYSDQKSCIHIYSSSVERILSDVRVKACPSEWVCEIIATCRCLNPVLGEIEWKWCGPKVVRQACGGIRWPCEACHDTLDW